MFNWVIYDRPESLFANCGAIAATYDGTGVRAWTGLHR